MYCKHLASVAVTMFEFLFDLPLLLVGPAIIGLLCLYSIIGLIIVRRQLLPRLKIKDTDADFNSAILESVMVFYGLALALIAVNVWENYSEVSKIITREATTLAALYRDVTSYPEPLRSTLQSDLREYVYDVIHKSWPLQRRGKIPSGGVEEMSRFQAALATFEPATEGQKLLHAETLHAYNDSIEARRMRLDALNTRLPAILWIVIVLGALISLSSSFFFVVEDARHQAIQVSLLAAFIGLIIFMILALDRPFRGDLGQPSEPYELIYDQLMKP
jgi:Protein of unknown function (DUF4239)